MKNIVLLLIVIVVIGAVVVVNNALKTRKPTISENGPQSQPKQQEQQVNTAPKQSDINNYDAPASIEPKELPEDLEGTIGFQPNQLDKLTDHFALAKYEIGQNSIIYYYQTAAATNGERFMVICTQMSQEDYLASIPKKNVTTEEYNGIELTYAQRWLYSVPNDFEMIDTIEKGIEEGTMEIEYGNTLKEVIMKDCFYWYDNGIKYEIQVRNQKLPYETLFDIAKKIIDAKNEN